MKDKRPVNLNLTTIHFPLAAIVSILHRICGVLLFLAFPFILWGLHWSLISEKTYNQTLQCIHYPIIRLLIWIVLSAVAYHVVAGIRHLLMDIGVGDTKLGGRISAITVMVVAIILVILLGVWIW